jgi:hypothetical protein
VARLLKQRPVPPVEVESSSDSDDDDGNKAKKKVDEPFTLSEADIRLLSTSPGPTWTDPPNHPDFDWSYAVMPSKGKLAHPRSPSLPTSDSDAPTPLRRKLNLPPPITLQNHFHFAAGFGTLGFVPPATPAGAVPKAAAPARPRFDASSISSDPYSDNEDVRPRSIEAFLASVTKHPMATKWRTCISNLGISFSSFLGTYGPTDEELLRTHTPPDIVGGGLLIGEVRQLKTSFTKYAASVQPAV